MDNLDLDIDQTPDFDDDATDTERDAIATLREQLHEAQQLANQAQRDLQRVRQLLRKMLEDDKRMGIYYHTITPRIYNELKREALNQ
jgi:pantothenate synthetase